MENRSWDWNVRTFLREFSYSSPREVPDKDDHVSDNLSDLEDVLPSLPPSSPDHPYPSLGRSRVYKRSAENARTILNSNLAIFFGMGVGLQLVLWLAARFERHLFRLVLLLLTKGLGATQWILVWILWVAQYVVFALLVIILLFSTAIASAWGFYSSVRAQRLVHTISKNPILHPIVFSAFIHSPLLVTHQFFPRWISYTLYVLLITRMIMGWELIQFALVPVHIVSALVLISFAFVQRHTKPMRWWNRFAEGWAAASEDSAGETEKERETPSEPMEEEAAAWEEEEEVPREEEVQEEEEVHEEHEEALGKKKRKKKKKKARDSGTT